MLNFPINEIICFRLYYYYTGNLFQNHWINQIYLVIKKALVFFARAFFIYAINSIYIMTSNCNFSHTYFSIVIIFVATFSTKVVSCSTKISVGLYFKIESSICSLVSISI